MHPPEQAVHPLPENSIKTVKQLHKRIPHRTVGDSFMAEMEFYPLRSNLLGGDKVNCGKAAREGGLGHTQSPPKPASGKGGILSSGEAEIRIMSAQAGGLCVNQCAHW